MGALFIWYFRNIKNSYIIMVFFLFIPTHYEYKIFDWRKKDEKITYISNIFSDDD